MKVPKTFIPEKDLEEKTKQLSKYPKLIKEEPHVLIEIALEEYDRLRALYTTKSSTKLDVAIDLLLRKKDYAILRMQKMGANHYEFWVKPSYQPDETLMFVRQFVGFVGYYLLSVQFARLHEDKLKAFFARFEKHEERKAEGYLYEEAEERVRDCCEEFIIVFKEAIERAFSET